MVVKLAKIKRSLNKAFLAIRKADKATKMVDFGPSAIPGEEPQIRKKKDEEKQTFEEKMETERKKDERDYIRERWKAVKQTHAIDLVQGKDDLEMAYLIEMLKSIISQPSDTPDARKEIYIAKTFLNQVEGQNKNAQVSSNKDRFRQLLDERRKKEEFPSKLPTKETPKMKTLKDFTQEELEEIQKREEYTPDDQKFQAVGKRFVNFLPDGRMLLHLTGPQLSLLVTLFEKAQKRISSKEKDNKLKEKPELTEEDYWKKLKERASESTEDGLVDFKDALKNFDPNQLDEDEDEDEDDY